MLDLNVVEAACEADLNGANLRGARRNRYTVLERMAELAAEFPNMASEQCFMLAMMEEGEAAMLKGKTMLDLNVIMAACENLTCDQHRGWTEGEEFIARARTWLPALVEELTQACEELAAVDESLGEFYAPVLDPETDEPCGSFWKDHGAWHAIEELELAQQRYLSAMQEVLRLEAEIERLRALVPPPELLRRLAEWANEAVLDGGDCLGEDMGTEEYPNTDDAKQAQTLARRIEEAQANDRT